MVNGGQQKRGKKTESLSSLISCEEKNSPTSAHLAPFCCLLWTVFWFLLLRGFWFACFLLFAWGFFPLFFFFRSPPLYMATGLVRCANILAAPPTPPATRCDVTEDSYCIGRNPGCGCVPMGGPAAYRYATFGAPGAAMYCCCCGTTKRCWACCTCCNCGCWTK